MNWTPGAAAVGLLLLLFGGDLLTIIRPANEETNAPMPNLADLSLDKKQACARTFPGLEVTGSSYPVPSAKAVAAQAVFYGQIGLIILLVTGDQIFAALGVPPPEIYNQVRDKKLGMAMAVWFLGNMLHNSLTQTGAFEVFYDGQQVFSKLQSNRMPNMDEILNKIALAMGLPSAQQAGQVA